MGYPGLTFLQVLFGHRTTDELRTMHPDCLINDDDGKVLADVLFPKQASRFWALT